jgi:allantoate deiminase
VGAEALARGREDMVATVGRIRVEPGARNVIPGSAALSLDLRHADDATRRAAVDDLRSLAERIAAARAIELQWTLVGETEALPLDPDLAGRLEEAVRATATPVARLASGAGHDGVAMSALAPVAMLFVRCEGGISHNPAEAVAEADVAVALDVLERFVVSLA